MEVVGNGRATAQDWRPSEKTDGTNKINARASLTATEPTQAAIARFGHDARATNQINAITAHNDYVGDAQNGTTNPCARG